MNDLTNFAKFLDAARSLDTTVDADAAYRAWRLTRDATRGDVQNAFPGVYLTDDEWRCLCLAITAIAGQHR
jgi:hypothetical protein